MKEGHEVEGSSATRVPFVQRGARSTPAVEDPDRDPDGEPLPGLRSRAMGWLLLLAVCLEAYAWYRLNGYQLADSVEFMDRAAAVARGDALDSTGAVRSFGFSTLLLPFIGLAEWFDLRDMRPVVHGVRLFQMLLGLGLVYYTTRIGARLGGRRCGYASGFLVAVNPIFLQYCVSPVSGIAAGFFVAFAVDRLIVRGSLRRSLAGGVSLGIAFMMAYQTLIISVPLVVLLVARDRLRHGRAYLGAGCGLLLGLAAQVTLDRITYGAWGVSIRTYLVENVGGVVVRILTEVGLRDTDFARAYYASYVEHLAGEIDLSGDAEVRQLQSQAWYFLELHKMIVWPVMALGLIGIALSWIRMNWKSSILLLILVANVVVMSLKGSKSFRLWLPLLPLIVPLCAWGWCALRGTQPGSRVSRRLVAQLFLVAALVLGVDTLAAVNNRRFGAYWSAIDYINREAALDRRRAEERGDEHVEQRVASAYNWAVFGRGSGDVRIVKLRQHIDQWHYLDEEQRAGVIEQLGWIHWLVMHGTIFPLHEDLTTAINEHFEVAASFWNEDSPPELRDVRVLRSLDHPTGPLPHPGARRAKRLWEVIEGRDPEAYREELQLTERVPQSVLFVGSGDGAREERLLLLGFEYEPLPASGFGWITYHWYSDTGFDTDYVLVDRVTSRRCPFAWHNNRMPGHGFLRTSAWKPGTIVREGYLLVPGDKPFEEAFRPIGGAYRRGDLLPATLWAFGESPPDSVKPRYLRPANPRTGQPLEIENGIQLEYGPILTPEGFLMTGDGLVQIAPFLLSFDERYRWPDDGKLGPDADVFAAMAEREALEMAAEASASEEETAEPQEQKGD